MKADHHLLTTTKNQTSFTWFFQTKALLVFLFFTLSLAGCIKDRTTKPAEDDAVFAKSEKQTEESKAFCLNNGLSFQTLRELERVRAATARYSTIRNAFGDGYEDMNLKMENMGYHFLKAGLVSPVFNLTKPPILVYNKKNNGRFELVAVEYAVPIDPQSPGTPPEGFTGKADKWDFNTLNSGWWTLHAWVWKFNPDGVFNMTNPLVIVK